MHQVTPAPVVYFLAGCLPLQVQLHLRMLSLFGQLCRLREGDNILSLHAKNIFSSANSSPKSWFCKLRNVCLQYDLPHPSAWLQARPTKYQVKSRTKTAVLKLWHDHYKSSSFILFLVYLGMKLLGKVKQQFRDLCKVPCTFRVPTRSEKFKCKTRGEKI